MEKQKRRLTERAVNDDERIASFDVCNPLALAALNVPGCLVICVFAATAA